jgi:tetratricopeptide (TPR) repeat protein
MDANTLYERAAVAIRTRQLDEARRLLYEAVRIDPRHENAWLALASVLNNMEQAIDCLKRVLAINPENKTAKEWLALALQEKARQEAVAEMSDDPAIAGVLIDEPGDEDRPVPRLGKYLLDYTFISGDQLRAALLAQRRAADGGQPKRLGDVLLEQNFITPERLDFALREQNRHFYNFIEE